MDNLKEYINKNRESFDDRDLPEGHLDRFEERLGNRSLNNRSGMLRTVLTGSEAALREQGTTIRDRVIKLRGNRRRIGWAIGIAAALAALVTIGWPAEEGVPGGYGKGDEGSSIITTASAPSGTAPPVGTAIQQPGCRLFSARCPIRISPSCGSSAGSDSEQPKVSFARTA